MINFIITENGVQECPGVPVPFFSDEEFRKVVADKQLQLKIRKRYGEDITIGIIGQEFSAGEFREEFQSINDPDIPVEGLGYYEKLNT